MIITEKDNYPVRYKDILVFPEYFADYNSLYSKMKEYKNDEINYYVVGVGKSYNKYHTTVLLLNNDLEVCDLRVKIAPFLGEGILPGLSLEAHQLKDDRKLGIVICKEVLHTAIAEVYRLMKVDIVAVTIGGGEFWDLQRHSWIDQMSLFSDITNAPLICACGATKEEGGINLIIER